MKETDDELVYAVQWFLSYLGFENVQNPDENVKDGEVFEEDLRIDGNEFLSYFFEVKGIVEPQPMRNAHKFQNRTQESKG